MGSHVTFTLPPPFGKNPLFVENMGEDNEDEKGRRKEEKCSKKKSKMKNERERIKKIKTKK